MKGKQIARHARRSVDLRAPSLGHSIVARVAGTRPHPMLRARPEGTKVQVIIPWHNTEASTVRAARSILSQTHKDLSLWIVCDGSDPSKLSTVEQGVGHDRRVRMLRLGSNHGPYLIHQAAAEATSAPFYAMQDSDDYSTEDRLEACLARKGDLVCCAFQDVQGGMTVAQSVERRPGQFSGQQFAAPLSPNHVGTWQTTSLLAIGGYWTGHRMASDTFAASLIWMCGRVEVTGKIGYIREIRPGSLTQHPSTGMGSPARKLARQELAQVWNRCLDEWRAVTSRGDTDPDLLASKIREIRRSKERADDRRRIENVRRALVELEASGVHDKTWTVNVETGAIAR